MNELAESTKKLTKSELLHEIIDAIAEERNKIETETSDNDYLRFLETGKKIGVELSLLAIGKILIHKQNQEMKN